MQENESLSNQKKTSKYKVFCWTLLYFLSIFLGVFFSFLFSLNYLTNPPPQKEKAPETLPISEYNGSYITTLPSFEVNLTSNKDKILKTTIALEFSKMSDLNSINSSLPKIQDVVITYLRLLSVDEILQTGGLFLLKQTLQQRINHILKPIHISDILLRNVMLEEIND